MKTLDDVRQMLNRLNGRGYKAYKELEGQYQCNRYVLCVDHVQGDPFASPSKIRVRVDRHVSGIPSGLSSNDVRTVAVRDFLTRCVERAIEKHVQGHRGIGKSGLVSIDAGGQEVLERTSMIVNNHWVEARMEVGLPASGRTILGQQAEAMLCDEIPRIVEDGLIWAQRPLEETWNFVNQIENYHVIRQQLDARGLVAFLADGSVLPRISGASDLPLVGEQVTTFQSPDSLRVTFDVPHEVGASEQRTHTISGLGIPKGITLMVGGGYHGKSTVLQALQRGVYPHIPGDGREYVVTAPDAVKVRAEDGRRIEGVNLSGFISNLPQGHATDSFSTENASGSTSQAATILEALEVGTKVILLDEDTSATNFMVRDARMQALVSKEAEPITPLVDRVRELYETLGLSMVLVMGGCGDYFDVADTVIMMRDFLPIEVTQEAKRVAHTYATKRRRELTAPMPKIVPRTPVRGTVNPSRGRKPVNISVRAANEMGFGMETIDLRGVEQLVDRSQTMAVGYALNLAAQQFVDGKATVTEIVEALLDLLDREGLDCLAPNDGHGRHPGNFAVPEGTKLRPLSIGSGLSS